MPDYGIASQVKVPDTFSTLGQIMNIAGAGIDLQRKRATLQADIERAQAESKRAGIEAGVAGETAGPRIETAKSQAGTAQQQFEQAKLVTLQSHVVNGVNQVLKLYGTGASPDDVKKIVQNTLTNAGAPPQAITQALSGISGDPAKVNDEIVRLAQSGMDIHNQLQSRLPAPQMITTGQVQVPVATGNPAQTGVPAGQVQGMGVQNVLPPTATAETLDQDALGRPIIKSTTPGGQIGVKPPPGTDYKPLMQLPPGETKETAAPLFALRQKVNQDAALVPAQRFNNKQILDLSSDAFTGTGSTKIAQILNATVSPYNPNAGSATAQLQHFISLQTVENAVRAGANSDQARELIARAVLPNEAPESAIKKITKINDGYVTGTEAFNKGMEAAIKNPQNTKDIFAVRDFQNAWSANFDPRIAILENAQKSKDTATVDLILGKKGSPQRAAIIKELTPKAKNLQMLSTEGHL